jgi:Uncharacterized conserved protein
MSYIDGFLAAVPVANKSAYLAHAQYMATVFMEYGALQVVENWADEVPHGKLTDFHRAVQAGDGEAVVFSWVRWPDKATRDAGWKAMENDPRMQADSLPMPFDGKRMVYGGFINLLDLPGAAATP